MYDFESVDAAIREVVPNVVLRHRDAGVLTWSLLHRMEDEVFSELFCSGKHDRTTLNMMRSAPAFGYPKDDRTVSFAGHSLVPAVFGAIAKVWNRVH